MNCKNEQWLSGGEYDYEVIEEVDGNVGFTHSLTAEYFATFEDCCSDFVKEVNQMMLLDLILAQ